ncbi:MAG: phospholipase D-like domain-containing protein [Victivallales bacterium]
MRRAPGNYSGGKTIAIATNGSTSSSDHLPHMKKYLQKIIGRKSKRWHERYVDGNEVKLLHGGAEFFLALEEHIRNARKTIQLQIYMLDPDDTGMRIIRLLKEAAARGVQVYVVLDAFGSQRIHENHIQDMLKTGIHIRKFAPMLSGLRISISRRMHHKIFVADGEIALTGGLNISDSYFGMHEAPWLDYGVQLRGPLCAEMEITCRARWRRQFRKNKIPVEHPPECGAVRARTSRNDWFRGRSQISKSYRDMLSRASKEVLMLSPYFLPGYRLTRLIMCARKRGVRVVLVLPGISDVPLMKNATDHLYATFLRHGIEIYEWKETVLHGKIAVMDSSWCTIGSYNPNVMSDYLSMEMNIDVDNIEFSSRLREEIESRIISHCRKITEDNYRKSNSFIMSMFNRIAYYTFWILLRLQYLLTSSK